MSFFEFRQSLALLMQRKQQRGNRTGKEQGRRTRRLLLESLEDRKMLAAVTIPWSSQVSYDQFTGGAPKIFGFGVDDGEPDANGDGKSDSSGIQKAPNFFGYDLPNTSFNIGNAVLGANANVSGKFGLQYGYYVNGGSASSIHSGNFSYDVQDTANADTVAINTGVNLNTGNLYTVSPKISGYVDLIARLNGNIAITSGGGSTTVPGDPSPFHLWGPHTITAPTQTWYNLPINVDAGATLLSVNRQVRDASGNPQFLSNGAPQFDGDIQVAGLTPSNKLSIPSNFEQQYADAVGTEKEQPLPRQRQSWRSRLRKQQLNRKRPRRKSMRLLPPSPTLPALPPALN